MGKLKDRLQKQLTIEDHRQDAEDCLKILDHLIETTGHVWESAWTPLVSVAFIGNYPYTRRYYATGLGKTLIKGMASEK